MSLINSLENKFGRHAVPGLVGLIAGLQVAVWILVTFQPEFRQWLTLNKAMLLHGELWRLVTFIFVPGQANPVWMFFSVMLLLLVGGTLEQAWGPFRVNLFVLGGMAFSALGVLLQTPAGLSDLLREAGADGVLGPDILNQLRRTPDVGVMCSFWFDTSIFFAFASVAPDFEILLFFILPLKSKYLAWLGGAMLLLDFVEHEALRIPMIFSLANFFIACGPGLWRHLAQSTKASARRARFQSAQIPTGDFFHQCAQCGKTEVDNPNLEFRVSADGAEYCSTCRPAKA